MPVYMIRVGERGPIKIGMSKSIVDLQNRLICIQTDHWETVRLIRLFAGGVAEERTLHARFADLRIRGEWFSFSRLMLGDVGLQPIAINPVRQADQPMPVRDLFTLLGGVGDVALYCGTSRGQASRWIHDNQIPKEKWPIILACAADLGITNITEGVLERMVPSGLPSRSKPGRQKVAA